MTKDKEGSHCCVCRICAVPEYVPGSRKIFVEKIGLSSWAKSSVVPRSSGYRSEAGRRRTKSKDLHYLRTAHKCDIRYTFNNALWMIIILWYFFEWETTTTMFTFWPINTEMYYIPASQMICADVCMNTDILSEILSVKNTTATISSITSGFAISMKQ